jgi:hypothetical protein
LTRHTAVHLLTVATFVVTVARVATAVDSTAEYRVLLPSIEGRIKAIETASLRMSWPCHAQSETPAFRSTVPTADCTRAAGGSSHGSV